MRRAEGCAAFFLRYFGGMQWEVWQVWLAAAMGLIILEVFVPGFVLACLGAGALAGAAAAAFGWGLSAQLVSVALFSLLSFFFLRPVALRMSQSEGTRTGVDALVGRNCRVSKSFDPDTGLGRCKVDGDDWRAQLSPQAQADAAPEGASVWVERVDSNTLIVRTQPPTP